MGYEVVANLRRRIFATATIGHTKVVMIRHLGGYRKLPEIV